MKRTWIILAALAMTLAGKVPVAQAQDGPTLGGHIGFVLPLVTHSGGQTTNLADQLSIGFPVGITVGPLRGKAASSKLISWRRTYN